MPWKQSISAYEPACTSVMRGFAPVMKYVPVPPAETTSDGEAVLREVVDRLDQLRVRGVRLAVAAPPGRARACSGPRSPACRAGGTCSQAGDALREGERLLLRAHAAALHADVDLDQQLELDPGRLRRAVELVDVARRRRPRP